MDMPFLNNAPGGGDLWAPAEGAGGDDATLNDLLALYQSANDANPPFAPMADAGAVGGTPSFGGSSSAVDAEIDELIRSFQDTPPPFSGGAAPAAVAPAAAAPAGAPIPAPPAIPVPAP
ncbi:MAG: hypothetical protein FJZ00_09945, partial [Candidatus Sericytochromatia bacterium]|nr:hypothetical protein [Candidatus Tanganyikabacteria bacterium]